ncbi:XRE family transcriptional regulator [Streptomyces sp. ODS28]|uniref:XRE family transcriptional regulator n=1 Tax=Streptomyces sp. ODS28 TaxID=3136688 RepID=UPI0031E7B2B3
MRNAAELTALMRQLKQDSGLTYRQLEERAAERGEVLPRSTLAGALRQDSLPRPELLRAFVRACGAGEEETAAWLAARHRIAVTVPGDDAKARPAPEPQRPTPQPPFATTHHTHHTRRTRRARSSALALVLIALLLSGGYFAAATFGDEDGEQRAPGAARQKVAGQREPAPAPPAPGTYRIRSAHSALCLSERDGEDSGELRQSDCRTSSPVYRLERSGDGYRIRSLHPVFGLGCMGVAGGSTVSGARMADDYCGHRGEAERMRLRPAKGAGSAYGYRIVLRHTGACVAVPGASRTEGAPVLQLPCAQHDKGQVFGFVPAKAPSKAPGEDPAGKPKTGSAPDARSDIGNAARR